MSAYEAVLVPVDGSTWSEEMIPYARVIAGKTDAKVVLLRVAESADEMDDAQTYVRSLADRLGVEGRAVTVEGDIASTILSVLEGEPNGQLAMATHGRAGIMEAILGSVTHAVVYRAGRPVVLYRPGAREMAARPPEITSIVVPIDGSDFAEQMLPHAAEMATAMGVRLFLVEVLAPASLEMERLPSGDVLESSYVASKARELKERYRIELDWDVLHGDPADAIIDHVRVLGTVMLAMSSHARSGPQRTILGSVTSECVRRSGVPVMVYKP